jgi:hypothetical protein
MLIKDTQLEQRLEAAMAEIGPAADQRIQWLLSRLQGRLQDGLQIDDQEMKRLAELAGLTHENVSQRFGSWELALRGGGAAAVGTAMAKTLGPKVAAKLAVKTAGKAAIKASGAGSGAAAGGAFGMLCGPAAIICAPIGAISGGLVGWFAVDKVVVETDEWLTHL